MGPEAQTADRRLGGPCAWGQGKTQTADSGLGEIDGNCKREGMQTADFGDGGAVRWMMPEAQIVDRRLEGSEGGANENADRRLGCFAEDGKGGKYRRPQTASASLGGERKRRPQT